MKSTYINKIIFCVIFLFVFSIFSYSQINFKRYDLNYTKWLELVHYILTPTERKIFLQLKSDKDKYGFIKLFWKQRDPTNGTEINEYKNDFIKRYEYVNKYFGRGTPRKGWQTDMGRMYLTLGQPQKIEKFDHINGLYPTIVWDYYGINIPGVPKNLTITFFKRNGFGEYVLYDPSTDGPASLLDNVETSFGKYDYKKIYKKLIKFAPQLAGPAFSVIPGRKSIMLPLVSNSLVLAKVLESPKKRIDTYYANKFNKFKGIVNVRQNYNILRSNFTYTIIKDPITKLYLLHFSVKPKKISFEYSNEYDKYFAALTLNVILKHKNKIVYKYDKKFSLTFNKDDFTNKIKQMGIAIDDMFPIINGNYTLAIYLKNSINNEFSYLEKKINVNLNDKRPIISKPFIGYRIVKSNQQIFRPFLFDNKIISIDSGNTYSTKDKIHLIIPIMNANKITNNKLVVEVKSISEHSKYNKLYTYNAKDLFNKKSIIINLSENLFSSDFDVKVTLYSKNQSPVKTYKTYFSISPLAFTNHPVEMMDGLNYKDMGLYYYRIALICRNMNKFKLAYHYYEKGYGINPKLYSELKNYLDFLLLLNKPTKADKIIETIKNIKEFNFEYNLYKGKIFVLKRNYGKALPYFNNAVKHFDKDTNLLNLTGLCYLKLSDKVNAKIFFSKSLIVNPKQPLIKKYIMNIDK